MFVIAGGGQSDPLLTRGGLDRGERGRLEVDGADPFLAVPADGRGGDLHGRDSKAGMKLEMTFGWGLKAAKVTKKGPGSNRFGKAPNCVLFGRKRNEGLQKIFKHDLDTKIK